MPGSKGRVKGKNVENVSKSTKKFVRRSIRSAVDMATEDKHIYGEISTGTLNNTTQAVVTHLTMSASGSGYPERVGLRIKVKWVKVRLEFRVSGANNIANYAQKFQHMRAMLIRLNHANATSVTIAGTNQGVFQTTVGGAGYSIALPNPVTCNMRNESNKNKIYNILSDKIREMKPLYSGQDLTSADTVGDIARVTLFKHYPKGLYVNFTAATTGVASSIQNNSHWILLAVGNTLADDTYSYSYAGHYDICYEDA